MYSCGKTVTYHVQVLYFKKTILQNYHHHHHCHCPHPLLHHHHPDIQYLYYHHHCNGNPPPPHHHLYHHQQRSHHPSTITTTSTFLARIFFLIPQYLVKNKIHFSAYLNVLFMNIYSEYKYKSIVHNQKQKKSEAI